MDAQATARAVADRITMAFWHEWDLAADHGEAVYEDLRDRIAAALQAERERCAVMAETMYPEPTAIDTGQIWRHIAGTQIAAAIRREGRDDTSSD